MDLPWISAAENRGSKILGLVMHNGAWPRKQKQMPPPVLLSAKIDAGFITGAIFRSRERFTATEYFLSMVAEAMQSRVKQAKSGEWYEIEFCKPYPLPERLKPGEYVTVMGFGNGYYRVRDKAGEEFEVFMLCVQTGFLFEVDGKWLEADDPLVTTEREREKKAVQQFEKWKEMTPLLRELEKQLSKVGPEEVITVRQDTLGLCGMNRRKMIEWLEERGFKALFIAETQAIEAKRK
jgi:hypothetical protein